MIDNNLHPEFIQQLCGGSHWPENRNSILCHATSASEANSVDFMDAQITLTNNSGIYQQLDTPAVLSKQFTKPCVTTPAESQAQSSTYDNTTDNACTGEETSLDTIITDLEISHGKEDSLDALRDSVNALENSTSTLIFVLDENASLETLAFELDAVLSDSAPVTHEVEIAFEW